jgi:DNA replication ATP-dependent helicase Dna2
VGNFYLVHQIQGNELTVVDRKGSEKRFIVNNPWYQFLKYLDKFSQVYISSESNIIRKSDYIVLEPNYLVSVTATIDAISCPRRIYVKNLGAEQRVSRDIQKKLTFGNLLHRVLSHRISFDADVENAITSVISKSKVDLLTSNISEKEALTYLNENSGIISTLNITGSTELDSQNWKYGLAGKFDAITDNRIIEFKSSKIPDLHPWPDHNLQMITYLKMMEDIQPYHGTVLYINDGQIGMKNPTPWPIEETVIARNFVYLVYQGKLIPPVLRGEVKKNCNSCFVKYGCYTLCAGLNTQRDCINCYHESDCNQIQWNDKVKNYLINFNESLYYEEKENHGEQYGLSQVGVEKEILENLITKGHALTTSNKISEKIEEGKFISKFQIDSEYNRFRNGDFTRAYSLDKDNKANQSVTLFYSTIIIEITSNNVILESSNPLPEIVVLVASNAASQIQSSRRSIFNFVNTPNPFTELITDTDEVNFTHIQSETTKLVNPVMDYNRSQHIAINLGLSSPDLMIIQGPAGTGKTSVIVELINQLQNQKKSVLCTAFTNMAVDNVAEKLSQHNLPFLRLGNQYSISQDIRKYGILGQPGQFRDFIDNNFDIPILSTTSTIAKKDYDHVSFDYVILDEAAQMTEPESLKALIKAKIVILVGDHAQLQPIVISDHAKKLNLHISLFERLANKVGNRFALLNEQYRMNDEILYFPNHQFYQKKLVSANEQIGSHKYHKFHGDILTADPYQLFVVQHHEELVKTQINLNEAKIAVKLVHEMITSDKIELHDIGIITPFRAQVALLRSVLPGLDIDTIDRFQGSERKIIIFSTVTMNEIPILTDPRRLNVALTRAKMKLVILVSNPDNETRSSLLHSMYLDANDRGLANSIILEDYNLSDEKLLTLRTDITKYFKISSEQFSFQETVSSLGSSIQLSRKTGIFYNSLELFLEDIKEGMCHICLQDVKKGIQCLGCLYWYHKDHLISWVMSNNNCPICKHALKMV